MPLEHAEASRLVIGCRRTYDICLWWRTTEHADERMMAQDGSRSASAGCMSVRKA